MNDPDKANKQFLPIKTAELHVHGGFAALNRGDDFVKHLVPALRARIG